MASFYNCRLTTLNIGSTSVLTAKLSLYYVYVDTRDRFVVLFGFVKTLRASGTALQVHNGEIYIHGEVYVSAVWDAGERLASHFTRKFTPPFTRLLPAEFDQQIQMEIFRSSLLNFNT